MVTLLVVLAQLPQLPPGSAPAGELEKRAFARVLPLLPADGVNQRMIGDYRATTATPRPEVRPNDGKVHLSRFGDGRKGASVDVRGPTPKAVQLCGLPGGDEVSPFSGPKFQGKYPRVVEKFAPARKPTDQGVGVNNPFYDDDSVPSSGVWRIEYPAYCASVSVTLNAEDPQGWTITRARALGAALHQGMVEAGLDQVLPYEPGKPLCDEALSYFGIKQPPATHIRQDYANLSKGFEAALARYKAETGQDTFMSVPGTGAVRALNWLFAEGGTWGNLSAEGKKYSQEFAFTDPDTGNSLVGYNKGIQEGTIPVKQGTEVALLREIVRESTDKKKKLDPGDVFLLALKQVKGDTRLAMLLAHNTTRSLARGADAEFTGVAPDLQFFNTYLAPIRGGPLPPAAPIKNQLELPPEPGQAADTTKLQGPAPATGDPLAGDNAGPWYHLFGTGFFEMQIQGDFASLPLQALQGARQTPLDAPPGAISEGNLSSLANSLEQYYREWLGGRSSDPEKYCFNVWGAKLSAVIGQNLRAQGKLKAGPAGARLMLGPNAREPAPPWEPGTAGSTTDISIKQAPLAPMANLPAKRTACAGAKAGACAKGAMLSPASITWEGGGQKLVFDQPRQQLRGSYPVALRFLPERDGTLAVVWADLSGQRTKVTFEGVRAGTVRVVTLQGEGRATAFSAAVRPGETLTMQHGPGAEAPALARADGRPVPAVRTGGGGGAVAAVQPGAAGDVQDGYDVGAPPAPGASPPTAGTPPPPAPFPPAVTSPPTATPPPASVPPDTAPPPPTAGPPSTGLPPPTGTPPPTSAPPVPARWPPPAYAEPPPATAATPPPSGEPLQGRVTLKTGAVAGIVLHNTSRTAWSGCTVTLPGQRKQALKSLPPGFQRELLYRYFTPDGAAPALRGEVLVQCAQGSGRFPAAL